MLTPTQLVEMEEYNKLEPIGGFRDDFRIAMLCDLVFQAVQAVAGRKGRRRKSSPMDWMPWGDGVGLPDEPKRQSLESMKAALESIAKKHGTRPRKH
jgi:hypothetical protein